MVLKGLAGGFVWALAAGWASLASVQALAQDSPAVEKIRVLIIDGQNNHNWVDTTQFLREKLEGTGLFSVRVSTTPARQAAQQAWSDWRPDFSSADVVLSNYNGPAWPEHVRQAFEAFIRQGGGLVNVHAANNAHSGWAEYETMTGLLWRGAKDGARLALNEQLEVVKQPAGEGPGAGHGPQHEYQVTSIDPEHPITAGLPKQWLHAKDELYHGQRGPAEGMHVLAAAYSSPEFRGTGMYEPMVWWIGYGKGKAVTILLGHVNANDRSEMPAMKCVGFLTLLYRSCQWAAGREVTVAKPDDFPK